MYEAEMNKKAHSGAVRFSNWRCSTCPTPSWDRSTVVGSRSHGLLYEICPRASRIAIQVLSSDDENTPLQPKRGATARPKSASLAAEDVIDLTDESAGLPSRKGKGKARDTSTLRSRLQTPNESGWEEYRSPISGLALGEFLPNASDPLLCVLNPALRGSKPTFCNSTST